MMPDLQDRMLRGLFSACVELMEEVHEARRAGSIRDLQTQNETLTQDLQLLRGFVRANRSDSA